MVVFLRGSFEFKNGKGKIPTTNSLFSYSDKMGFSLASCPEDAEPQNVICNIELFASETSNSVSNFEESKGTI